MNSRTSYLIVGFVVVICLVLMASDESMSHIWAL